MHVYCTYKFSIYVYACIHVYACICMYCTYMHVCASMNVCTYMHVYARIARISIYEHMFCMYMHVSISVDIYMCIYVHIRVIRTYAHCSKYSGGPPFPAVLPDFPPKLNISFRKLECAHFGPFISRRGLYNSAVEGAMTRPVQVLFFWSRRFSSRCTM